MIKSTFIFIISTILSYSSNLPIIDVQFGGPLKRSCSFVNNRDVIDSLTATLAVLNRIQEVESRCQSILVNSKAFIQAGLNDAISRENRYRVSVVNKNILEGLIQDKVDTGAYHGEYDFELLQSFKEIELYKNKEYIKEERIAQTMKLGMTLFDNLKDAPVSCTHTFGKDLLSPAIGITGRVFTVTDPGISLVAGLLSSIIDYSNRILNKSYSSLRDLTSAKNFHMSYKCTMKNIENIICGLEEKEKSNQEKRNDTDYENFLFDYKKKTLSYDTPSNDFKKYIHLRRHNYRILKIIEDLDNIYRSPETANDLKKVVSYQTSFAGLSLMPRLNPLRNTTYVRLMEEAGHIGRGEIIPTWSEWDNNKATWSTWMGTISDDSFRQLIDNGCRSIDVEEYPEFRGLYPQGSHCQYYNLRRESDITTFIEIVVMPALVFVQGEIGQLNEKIKGNANIHALYTNIKNQGQNIGNPGFEEYTLSELFNLLKTHAKDNRESSLKLYADDIINIVNVLEPLGASGILKLDDPFESFIRASKEAYASIAKISNNGMESGVLYRSIIESKISSYIDGVRNNFLFNENKKLAKRFANFLFHSDYLEKLIDSVDLPSGEGSSNLSLMLSVENSFVKTFEETIVDQMDKSVQKYKKNSLLKRDLIHSCAIFMPLLKGGKPSRRVVRHKKTKVVFRMGKKREIYEFCMGLAKTNRGISIFSSSKEKFPFETKKGLRFGDKCYYKKYEEAVTRFKINNAKRMKARSKLRI